jgi:dTDP-4-amino-4,6-dideoxygalactose transaminase/acetyltransferase-like isoleucine patch superfamily enzyme
VHPSAIIDDDVELGQGARVWQFAHVCRGARIGAGSSLGQNVYVGEGVTIGCNARIQNNVSVYSGVAIADDVFLGPSCVFTNVGTPRAFAPRHGVYERTQVERGASIGANATIVCGNDIGAFALVGAGAVVTRAVAAHALVVGNPAHRIGWVCRCGARLAEEPSSRCGACRQEYLIDGEVCRPATDFDHPDVDADAALTIPMFDAAAQNAPLMPALRAASDRVLASGHYILGEQVQAFEEDVAAYLGVRHAIAVSSGTDALLVALMALGIGHGDEVVTTAFSFAATAMAVARLGARPIFVDVDPHSYNIDPAAVAAALTPRTRAVLPVHLFGQPCDMDELRRVAARRDVPLVEDAAQSLGARTRAGAAGTLGRLGCFSFFPTKNLGAFGDGGLVTTDDASLAARVRALRVQGADRRHHHVAIGGNFRMDALQAALLRVKLPHLDRWTAARRGNAQLYTDLFAAAALDEAVLQPPRQVADDHVWNQYVVRCPRRDALRAALAERGIASEVYYPVPLHQQPCFLGAGTAALPVAERLAAEALALPVYPELGEARLRHVASAVVECLRGG